MDLCMKSLLFFYIAFTFKISQKASIFKFSLSQLSLSLRIIATLSNPPTLFSFAFAA